MMPVRALVEGGPQASATVPAQTTIGTTAAVVLLPNQKRKGLIIQNTGTTVIRLSLGTTLPTQTVYHVALAAASSADNGSGGIYIDDSWVGAVSAVSSSAGGTFVLVEITTGSPDWNASGDYGQKGFLG